MDFLTPLSAQYGLLGLLLAIALFVIGYKERQQNAERNQWREEVKRLNEARVQDMREVRDKIIGPIEELASAQKAMGSTVEVMFDWMKKQNHA